MPKGVPPFFVVGYNRRVSRLLWIALVVGVLGCKREQAAPPPPPLGDAAAQSADGDAGPDGSSIDLEQKRFDEERRPDLIVAALGLRPGAKVADVGAGTGLLTVHLARAVMPGGKVVATDVAEAVMELLKQRLAKTQLTDVVEPLLVAPDVPGLEAGAFDAILLAEVDNYIADPVAWLVAAKPALKPGGAIAITNRIYHRARGLAAAKAAGLHLVSESTPVPSTFIAVFRAELPVATPTSPPPAAPRH